MQQRAATQVQATFQMVKNIVIRVAFKPTATIRKEQKTVDNTGQETTLTGKGRHDPCVLPRAVPMVEAMVALVLCDHLLRHQAQCGTLGIPVSFKSEQSS